MADITLNRAALDRLPEGLKAPAFDLARRSPGIVHIGLGGFHRAHMARYTHDLMAASPEALEWGVVGAGLRTEDAPLLSALDEQDGLYTLVEREGDTEQATIIGALVGTIDASSSSARLLAAIDDPAVRIVSLTVTENGYHLNRATRTLDFEDPAVARDLANPADPRTALGVVCEAYRRRRDSGARAFTTLCCDNIPHNGDVVRAAVLALAERRDPALAQWIAREASFPNAMVDRITPVPSDAQVQAFAQSRGLVDRAPIFAELFRQWVIEDRFVAGRPAWETAGVQFVADVTPYEIMKLRLLNGSHLAIAGLGQLAGYETIGETVADPLIRRFMVALMARESGPTLAPVPGVDLADYQARLVTRFANPAIHDTVQRVNSDAAVNVLLDPIRARLAANASVDLLALGLAAWCRRVRGEDEAGRPLAVVHPLADVLRARAIEGGADPAPLLSIAPLFGELGAHAGLVRAVGHWLAALYDVGAARTLRQAADAGAF